MTCPPCALLELLVIRGLTIFKYFSLNCTNRYSPLWFYGIFFIQFTYSPVYIWIRYRQRQDLTFTIEFGGLRKCYPLITSFFLSKFKVFRSRNWWWILKQITQIIVFQNCQLHEDCPRRCHCSLELFVSLLPMEAPLTPQIARDIVISSERIISSNI